MNNIYDIWFARVKVANRIKAKLYENFTTREIFYFTEEKYIKLGLKTVSIEKFLEKNNKIGLEKYQKYMEQNKIIQIFINSKEYPNSLKNILDAPIYIFAKGNIEILKKECIAIIGARNSSNYGKKIAFETAKELSNLNINTVSGMANGVDSFAHLGSLQGKYGKTIAVLANGLSNQDIYPRNNVGLYNKIIQNNGLVISEYIVGTKAKPYYFLERNRIVSGLANKILVTEAGDKSGTMITVGYGLDQGKDIFAAPRKYL
ncbi:MAG: DNA-protecting protein DprA [Clostridia bacterium]|nr:DNA-protecting protein DprA [Clostridia bacterium]